MEFAPKEQKLSQSPAEPYLRSVPPQALAIGTVIDEKYEVVDVLGQGGMGIVYLVTHRLLGKMFALKMLRSDVLSDPADRLRFEQEAKALGRLHHSNIVAVTDFGSVADAPYLVMEYVQGRTLSDLIKQQGPLTIPQFCDIFSQVANALAHAHASGIVHRDLKPSNVVIEKSGRAIILDFGIAKMVSAGQNADSVTITGALVGSPSYMSPEQAQGHKVTLMSDMYSLGCTMYEALVGVPPFQADNPLATLMMHMQAQPEGISVRSNRSDVPATISDMVAQLLAKVPEDRNLDASAVQTTLDNIAAGRQPETIKWSGFPLVAGKKRVAAFLGVGFAVCVALHFGSLMFAQYFHPRVTKQVEQVMTPPVGPSRLAEIKDAQAKIAEAYAAMQWLKIEQLAEKYQPIAERELGPHSSESMSLLFSWANALRVQGKYVKGAELFSRDAQLSKEENAAPTSMALIYLCQGICECRLGNHAKADQLLKDSAEMRVQAGDAAGSGEAMFWRGWNANAAKDTTTALKYFEQAKFSYEEASDWPFVRLCIDSSVAAKQKSGDFKGALRYVQAAYDKAAASKNEALRALLEPSLENARYAALPR